MADTGFKIPAAQTETDNSGGQAWTSPANILTDNTSYASANIQSTAPYSDFLFGYTFDFSAVPSDATINGIEVQVSCYVEDVIEIDEYLVRLAQGTTAVGDNKAGSGNITETVSNLTYGGSSDTWNASLSTSDIKNSNFGIVVSYENIGTLRRNAYVNTIRTKIYYTEASGSSEASMLLHMGAF